MNQKVKLKYGTPLMVLSIIVMVFSALASIGLMFLRDLTIGLFPEEPATAGVDLILNTAAVIVLVTGVLILVGGINARYSKGWSIFLIVIAGLSTLFALIQVEIFTLFLYGAITVLAALNVHDAHVKSQGVTTTQIGRGTLEEGLKNLNELYNRGLITQEEYNQSREDLLSRY